MWTANRRTMLSYLVGIWPLRKLWNIGPTYPFPVAPPDFSQLVHFVQCLSQAPLDMSNWYFKINAIEKRRCLDPQPWSNTYFFEYFYPPISHLQTGRSILVHTDYKYILLNSSKWFPFFVFNLAHCAIIVSCLKFVVVEDLIRALKDTEVKKSSPTQAW